MSMRPVDFMRIADIMASRATCSRLQVGALVVRDRRIISTGYNGAPAGLPHCEHDRLDEPCLVSVHAEANAIAFAAKHGVSVQGADLYTTDSPCLTCAQLIINAGIRGVIYGTIYRDQSGLELLDRAGIGTFQVEEHGMRLVPHSQGHGAQVSDWEPPYDVRGYPPPSGSWRGAWRERGEDRDPVQRSSGATSVEQAESPSYQQGSLFGDQRGEMPPGEQQDPNPRRNPYLHGHLRGEGTGSGPTKVRLSPRECGSKGYSEQDGNHLT